MILAEETLITGRKTCRTATLSNTNSTWTGMVQNTNVIRSNQNSPYSGSGHGVMGYSEYGNVIILKFSIPYILTLVYTSQLDQPNAQLPISISERVLISP